VATHSGFAASLEDLSTPSERFGSTVAFAMPESLPHVTMLVDVDGELGQHVEVAVDDEVDQAFSGDVQLGLTSGIDFFERMHVVPRYFDFGNVLSAQVAAFEVFNGYRKTFITWVTFVPVDDSGTTVDDFPGVPVLVPPLGGYQMELEVSTTGEPVVDDEMEFVFDDGSTILVPVEIERIVLVVPRPELPFTEELAWLTDVQEAKDGSELRVSVRQYARQAFLYDYKLPELEDEDVDARMALEASTFDWQHRAFGLPVWFDEMFLTVEALAGASSVTVASTAFVDLRVGGLVALLVDRVSFDVQTVASFTSTTITFENPIVGAYPVGTSVLPVRTARASTRLDGERHPVNLEEQSSRFEVEDNAIDIASGAAFSSFNSKVLLDDPNALRRTSGFTYERGGLVVIDGKTGVVERTSSHDRSKRSSTKVFIAQGRQAVWELRQLLHLLRGQQVSFYLPRFRRDLRPTQNLVSGSAALTVSNIGYTRFIRQRQPLNVLRVTFTSGTVLMRTVLSSLEVDATEETLTLDSTWPSTFTPADVERIELVEKVRLSADRVRIEYGENGNSARCTAPVVAVFE
jgi:hypothetical protein